MRYQRNALDTIGKVVYNQSFFLVKQEKLSLLIYFCLKLKDKILCVVLVALLQQGCGGLEMVLKGFARMLAGLDRISCKNRLNKL